MEDQYHNGLITKGEGYNKIIDIWARIVSKITNEVFEELKREDQRIENGTAPKGTDFNGLYLMAESCARGVNCRVGSLEKLAGGTQLSAII